MGEGGARGPQAAEGGTGQAGREGPGAIGRIWAF